MEKFTQIQILLMGVYNFLRHRKMYFKIEFKK